MEKVITVNLEEGMPTVDEALRLMDAALSTGRRQGVRAVILIHGYGSTGAGGGIRAAVRRRLEDRALRGIVRMSAGGEQWAARKRELLAACGSLCGYERAIAGNEGVTVAVLRR